MEEVGASFFLDQLQTLMKGGTAHWTKTAVHCKYVQWNYSGSALEKL